MGSRYCFSCRQLRLITMLLKFERQFSGRLRIAGTNYRLSRAGLIGVWGQQAEGQPAVPGSCSPNLPAAMANANAWLFQGTGCFFAERYHVCSFSTVLCMYLSTQECMHSCKQVYAHVCVLYVGMYMLGYVYMCVGVHVCSYIWVYVYSTISIIFYSQMHLLNHLETDLSAVGKHLGPYFKEWHLVFPWTSTLWNYLLLGLTSVPWISTNWPCMLRR